MDDHTQSTHNKSTNKNNIFKDIDQDNSKLNNIIRLLKPRDDRHSNTISKKNTKKDTEGSVLVQQLMSISTSGQNREECWRDCKSLLKLRLD